MGHVARAVFAPALWALSALLWPAWAQQIAQVDFGAYQASAHARLVAERIMSAADHGGRPFAIVDKRDARIYVFDSLGHLSGVSPALLGQASGDGSAPDVGAHADAGSVPFSERTTPSGRFVSQPGLNLDGDHVVWIDYTIALAIHRLRPGAGQMRREALLASATPLDNRASLGCVVVPAAFYDDVVRPLLGRGRGVVYVLPEERAVRDAL